MARRGASTQKAARRCSPAAVAARPWANNAKVSADKSNSEKRNQRVLLRKSQQRARDECSGRQRRRRRLDRRTRQTIELRAKHTYIPPPPEQFSCLLIGKFTHTHRHEQSNNNGGGELARRPCPSEMRLRLGVERRWQAGM